MAGFNKVNDFVEHLAEGVHNLGSDQLTVALSNLSPSDEVSSGTGTDPSTSGNGLLANVTEISNYGNASSRDLTVSSSAESGGTYKLVLSDLTINASGTVGPFKYIYIYNSGTTALTNPLIGYYIYPSNLTLENNESLTLAFDGTTGVIQVT